MYRGRRGMMLYVPKGEYDRYPADMKGIVSSEYTDEERHGSFMWNRTLMINGILYVDGLSMRIVD